MSRFTYNYFRTWLIIKKKQLTSYGLYRSREYTKFVILCNARSGSTWLHTLLNSHPQIISKGEILRRTFEKNQIERIQSLNDHVFTPYSTRIEAVGLKIFYEYQEDEYFKRFFDELQNDVSIRIIHLIRKDKLAQYVSLKLAETTSQWNLVRSNEINARSRIRIDRGEFNAYQSKSADKQDELTRLFANHKVLNISYENLCESLDENLERIQLFLEVKPLKLFSLLKKQSIAPINDQIENWEDFSNS